MSSILTHRSAAATILDNYADVIEGGNSYRGSGDSYQGIPGTNFANLDLRGTTITASGAGSTTSIPFASGDYATDFWVKNDSPRFFLMSTNGNNNGAARRISNWDNSGKAFTVAAFDNAVSENDTFVPLQGFKRFPDNLDILSDESTIGSGFDRFFELKLGAGTRIPFYGSGVETYESELVLRLRLQKRSRSRDTIESAMENALLMRSILTRPTHRDGTFTQLLNGEEGAPEVETETDKIVVVSDSYNIRYRVFSTFL
jgi:hypothetical protein